MKKRFTRRKIFFMILALIILLGIIISYSLKDKEDFVEECKIDNDCVPASCCHPNSCISKEQKPDCEGILCSMSCEGPLDCGAGHCGCIKNKCEVVQD